MILQKKQQKPSSPMKMLPTISKFMASSIQNKPIRIIQTSSNNIHLNLAYEQYLFQKQITIPTLFLWRNSPTIVIGKHQNPWKECKIDEMNRDGVMLSRRITGGGAVYQDLGNTCFSFLTPFQKNQQIDYRNINNEIILNALLSLGIKAEVSGRNDITIDGKKFSGSAYRLHLGTKQGVGKKSLHHGTIMFNVNFKALQKYLNPNKKKLQSKGIESVISRVINLNSKYQHVNHQKFCQAIQNSFCQYYHHGQYHREILNEKQTLQNQIVVANYERLKSWEWLYGQCPYFKYVIQKKFDWGLIQITFEIKNGRIQKCKIYSDCLFPDFITNINDKMIGVVYDNNGIDGIMETITKQYADNLNFVNMGQDVFKWIKSEM